jgi:hypothetical protein
VKMHQWQIADNELLLNMVLYSCPKLANAN